MPKVFYKTSENTRKLLDHGIDSAKKLLEEAGCYETNVVPTLESAGWHFNGYSKNGNDPKTSVVDANCKTHDVDNLYIIDGSVFTTSAAVNPTPTIQAVALRAADKIFYKDKEMAISSVDISNLYFFVDTIIPSTDDMPAASEVIFCR